MRANEEHEWRRQRLAAWSVAALAFVYAFVCSRRAWFFGDAVGYGFFISPEYNSFDITRIDDVSQLLPSQINHWFTCNGRFLCHLAVQYFCALTPQWVWAVANGLCYAAIVLSGGMLALWGEDRRDYGLRCLLSFMMLLLVSRSTDYCPPLQINYIWNFLWQTLFLCGLQTEQKTWKRWKSAVWVVVAFVAGQWNEAFSLPMIAGICIVWLSGRHEMKWGKIRRVGMAAYIVGALTLVAAPGNFARFQDVSGAHQTWYLVGERFVLALYPLVVGTGAFLLLYGARGWRRISGSFWAKVLVAVIVTAYLMGIALRFSSGTRIVAAAGYAMFVAVVSCGAMMRVRKWGVAVTAVCALVAVSAWIFRAERDAARHCEFETLYAASPDGRIFVDADLLRDNWRSTRWVSFYYRMKLRSERLEAVPPVKILPKEAAVVRTDSAHNASIRIDANVWLLVRSIDDPADFVVRKRMRHLPGLVRLPERRLDFESPWADVPVDTVGRVVLGLYVNEREWIEPEIVCLTSR